VDNPFKSPAVLSFCPGILGLERGVEQAIGKIRVAAYVEIEAFIIANLIAGMESGVLDPAPIWTDATTFDASPFYRKIHGIIGGYPCPGESLAGLREGHLYKGFIWPNIRRAIAATRPVWCFFENVDDHLSGTFPIVLRSLHNMGYAVEAGVYTAAEVGAPHERKRLFIFALAESYKMAARGRIADLLGQSKANEAATWKQDRKWGRNGFSIISEELVDPGLLGSNREGQQTARSKQPGKKLANTKNRKNKRGGSGNMETTGRQGPGIDTAIANGGAKLESADDQGFCEPESSGAGFIQSTTPLSSGLSPIHDPVGVGDGQRILGEDRESGSRNEQNRKREKLAHSVSPGFKELGDDGKPAEESDNRIVDTSTELGNTESERSQGYNKSVPGKHHETGEENRRGSIWDNGANQYNKRYPAGQGQFQYDWEEKRTIEPGLGITINGYNFREDLLRASGNSVVADCAEIAFIELLNKHIENKCQH